MGDEYPLMGIGGGLLNECGDQSDPVMAKAILGYSPFQNVREDTKYSPFLITISAEDNRVGPGHARKFAHRLMDVGAPTCFTRMEKAVVSAMRCAIRNSWHQGRAS